MYQIKHCRECYTANIARKDWSRDTLLRATVYICLSTNLFVLYWPYNTRSSALSGIENVRLEEIHSSRNSVLKSSQVTHVDIVSVLGNIFLLFWA